MDQERCEAFDLGVMCSQSNEPCIKWKLRCSGIVRKAKVTQMLCVGSQLRNVNSQMK